MRKFLFITSLILFSVIAIGVSAQTVGEQRNFYVDPTYDLSRREEISAILKKIGQGAYFYIDNQWWEALNYQEKQGVEQALQSLDLEFYQKIYPILTTNFGFERKPGVDNDNRITILIHSMREEAGGYFNSGDEYLKLQNPRSNEREMVYLNANYINSSLAKSFLAHEFIHLITFNQKENAYNMTEETWLNEARAEYVPTLLGYDSEYEGTNLQRRVRIFLESPSDSLTEWQNKKADYGVVNIFIQYLVEQYGIEILTSSLKLKKTGINSLNEVLQAKGFKENFSQIFTDWTITILVNNCSLGERYCYKNKNLQKLQVIPLLNFLPIQGKSTLGVSQSAKNWAGNWFKIIGGRGTLKIEFIGHPESLFKIPYLVKDFSDKYSLNFFQLNEYQRGEISISDFGSQINSVVIIPSIQGKTSDFLNPESAFTFFWSASITDEKGKDFSKYLEKPISEMSKKEILSKISEIEELLTQLKTQLAKLSIPEENLCQKFEENLFYGLTNDNNVKCLQEFLKSQGPEIYPEGFVTGNFLSLTQAAVIRFQEKYTLEILTPLELIKGTGFVGPETRAKINELKGLTK